MTRREFALTSAAALSTAPAAPAASLPDWPERAHRWAQIVFVEDDPGNWDIQFWLDYIKRIKADALNLSAGGYMAFYPTRIPLHYKSKYLGSSDPFGDFVREARKLGMVVVARTDPHAIHDDAATAHPEWVHVNADGKPRRHWANPELWVTCALGPYNFGFMTEVTKEIVALYGVDGIFANRWAGHGQCFCEPCRQNFKAATGHELPRRPDPQDAARRAYIQWRQQRLFEVARLWDAEIRKLNPHGCFIANSGGGTLSDLDMKTLGEISRTLFADRQARRGLTAPWAAGKNAKEYRAAMGRKPIAGITSVGVEEPYRWKDSVQHGPEIKMWMVDGIAHDLRPWFIKFNAKPYDKRWMKPVEEVYTWHAANERYLCNQSPVARVAMVYSQQTANYYGGEQARTKVEDHTQGFYQALIEARVPFEMVHDRKLDAASLRPFKTLILPNIAALSDEQCRQLEQFTQAGGSLVATHETSLYDEWGKRRSDLGLAGLFGARFTGTVEPRMQNSYLKLHGPHPLLRGLEDTERIINGVSRVHTAAASGIKFPLTVIPTYPDLPMEDVYPRSVPPDIPAVHLRELPAGGRVVYFPWDIDRTFWEVLSVDHFTLLRNAVDWATNEPPVIGVTGPGVLDVSVWRQPSSLTVHLVNLTNPMMMKGPIREFYPVGLIQVELPAALVKGMKRARLLVRNTEASTKSDRDIVRIGVPSFGLHEVIAIDLA